MSDAGELVHPTDKVLYITDVTSVDGETRPTSFGGRLFEDRRLAEKFLFDGLMPYTDEIEVEEFQMWLGSGVGAKRTEFLDGAGDVMGEVRPVQMWEEESECIECERKLGGYQGKCATGA
ncbi:MULTISPECIES: hypothetical protein [Haloarcula]|uniref:hypothetical protein n=1 Tax=Haloarcula TaxID=2237 RepID=UPI0023ED141E|nr:hypothetical protein [Halomicroarcula sp. XH51]